MNTDFKKIFYSILIFAAIAFYFINGESIFKPFNKQPNDKRLAQETVRFYNLALEKVFENNKSSYLDNYADAMEKRRVELYFLSLIQEQKIHQKIKLVELKFKKIKINKSKANIYTEELWNNSYFNVNNPTIKTGADEKVFYRMQYTLQKTKKGWLVNKVNVEDEKKIE